MFCEMSVKKKAVRAAFRKAVFERDNYTCVVCGHKWDIEESDPSLQLVNAHHIEDRSTMIDGGYTVNNGVTVCDIKSFDNPNDSCHMKVEKFHSTGIADPGLHPNDLKRMIGVSIMTKTEEFHILSDRIVE